MSTNGGSGESNGPRRRRTTSEITFNVPLNLDGDEFVIPVCERSLDFSLSSPVKYYWIDSRRIRGSQGNSSETLCRVITQHWRRAMQVKGTWDDVRLRDFLLASCYPAFADLKNMQKIYLDAYLRDSRNDQTARRQATGTDADSRNIGHDDDNRRRIVELGRNGSIDDLRQEFNRLFAGLQPTAEDHASMHVMGGDIVGRGIQNYEANQDDGVTAFVKAVKDAYCTARKNARGNPAISRFFWSFAYNCKIAFYTCFANVWIDLIPWLQNHQQLDSVAERFLRFWNFQHTASTVTVDIFAGQLLSLHPLSVFFMVDPASCAAAGRLFSSTAWNSTCRPGDPEYPLHRDVLVAILFASNSYRLVRDRETVRRSSTEELRADSESIPPEGAADQAGSMDNETLINMAKALDFSCPECNLPLEGLDASKPNAGGVVTLTGQCIQCHKEYSRSVTRNELRHALETEEDENDAESE